MKAAATRAMKKANQKAKTRKDNVTTNSRARRAGKAMKKTRKKAMKTAMKKAAKPTPAMARELRRVKYLSGVLESWLLKDTAESECIRDNRLRILEEKMGRVYRELMPLSLRSIEYD